MRSSPISRYRTWEVNPDIRQAESHKRHSPFLLDQNSLNVNRNSNVETVLLETQ